MGGMTKNRKTHMCRILNALYLRYNWNLFDSYVDTFNRTLFLALFCAARPNGCFSTQAHTNLAVIIKWYDWTVQLHADSASKVVFFWGTMRHLHLYRAQRKQCGGSGSVTSNPALHSTWGLGSQYLQRACLELVNVAHGSALWNTQNFH